MRPNRKGPLAPASCATPAPHSLTEPDASPEAPKREALGSVLDFLPAHRAIGSSVPRDASGRPLAPSITARPARPPGSAGSARARFAAASSRFICAEIPLGEARSGIARHTWAAESGFFATAAAAARPASPIARAAALGSSARGAAR